MLVQTTSSKSSSHVRVAAEATKELHKGGDGMARTGLIMLLMSRLWLEEPPCMNSYVERVEYSTWKMQPRIQLAPLSIHRKKGAILTPSFFSLRQSLRSKFNPSTEGLQRNSIAKLRMQLRLNFGWISMYGTYHRPHFFHSIYCARTDNL